MTEMDFTKREELVQAYINQMIDSMDTKDLIRIVWEQLEENLKDYSDDELITEIRECHPEVLSDVKIF